MREESRMVQKGFKQVELLIENTLLRKSQLEPEVFGYLAAGIV